MIDKWWDHFKMQPCNPVTKITDWNHYKLLKLLECSSGSYGASTDLIFAHRKYNLLAKKAHKNEIFLPDKG